MLVQRVVCTSHGAGTAWYVKEAHGDIQGAVGGKGQREGRKNNSSDSELLNPIIPSCETDM